jgi:hypothetical protein
MNELDKLDEIDRKVLLWCMRHHQGDISHVLKMYQRDYAQKGITLNVDTLISEVKNTVWNKS